MAGLNVEIAPTAEPVPLALVKNHLRITTSADDELISGIYMPAARELVEDATALSLVNKGYRQNLDGFPHQPGFFGIGLTSYELAERAGSDRRHKHHQRIKLFRSPLVSVTNITYLGTDQEEHVLYPTPALWAPNTEYTLGDERQDSNGNLQTLTAINEAELEEDGTATSGATTPAWSVILGGTTADGLALTWTNGGTAYVGDFQVNADDRPPSVFPTYGTVWPDALHQENVVQIHFVAGFGDDGIAAPARAKLVLMMLVGTWYENRESVTEADLKTIPHHLEDLLGSVRILDFNP
jgi:hypothetical protein